MTNPPKVLYSTFMGRKSKDQHKSARQHLLYDLYALVMVGLKTYAPNLAVTLGTTATTLHARQRKLVEAGLLSGPPGRGPGSGARATPETVSQMIIACMASDDLADVEVRVRRLAEKSSDIGRCDLTGALTFGEAMIAVLRDEDVAAMVQKVVVFRASQSAAIFFAEKGRKTLKSSTFGAPTVRRDENSKYALEIEAHLPGEAVRSVAGDLEAHKTIDKALLREKERLK